MSRRYVEQIQHLVAEYIDAGESWPAPSRTIARWMIRTKRWDRGEATLVDLCARDIARALREEYHTDPQGRRVRTKHAARLPAIPGSEEQMTFWNDIRTAPRDFMERAFKQRRNQIVGDCAQLKTDVDSYNDNASKSEPIQMLFDFTDDLAEMEQSGELDDSLDEYDPTAPAEDTPDIGHVPSESATDFLNVRDTR